MRTNSFDRILDTRQVVPHLLRYGLVVSFALLALLAPGQLAATPWASFRGNASNTGVGIAYGANGHQLFSYPSASPSDFGSTPIIAPDGSLLEVVGNVLYSINQSNPSNVVTNWSVPISGTNPVDPIGTPSIGADLSVYVGSAAGLVAIDLTKKSTRWVADLSADCSFCSPAIGPDGTVYVTGVTANGAGILAAISNTTGATKWSYTFTKSTGSSPTVDSSGSVYVGADDSNVYSFDNLGNLRWTFPTSGLMRCTAALSYDSQAIFFATDQGMCYSVSTSSGTVKWTNEHTVLPQSGDLQPSPAVGPFGDVYFAFSDGALLKVEAGSGDIEWETTTLGRPSSPSVGSNGTLFVVGANAGVGAYDYLGNTLWTVGAGQNTTNSSVAIGGDGTLYAYYAGALLAVQSPHLVSIKVSGPTTIVGGNNIAYIVTLDAVPGPDGVGVAITSNPTSVMPQTEVVGLLSDQTSTTLWIPTVGVASNVTGQLLGRLGSTQLSSQDFTLIPASPVTLTVGPTLALGGEEASGWVGLNGAAPPSGLVVNIQLKSNVASAPTTVTIPPYQNQASFSILTKPVSSPVSVLVSASYGQWTSTNSFKVGPLTLTSLLSQDATLIGGRSTTGSIYMNGLAPKAATVKLSYSGGLSGPATVVVPQNKLMANFTISTSAIGPSIGTVTASYGPVATSLSIGITSPNYYAITLAQSSIFGGASTTGTLTLNGAAGPGGVTLSMSSPVSGISVPAQVKVRAGQKSVSFPITTSQVTSMEQMQIKVNMTGYSEVLTVLPYILNSMTLRAAVVSGGQATVAELKLNAPAPSGGLTITLTNNNPAIANVPLTVKVPAGASVVNVPIKTLQVTSVQLAAISAQLDSSQVSATLAVHP